MRTRETLLIVEDDPVGLATMSGYFEVEGYNVLHATDSQEMDRVLARNAVDLIILDLRLPGKDGLAVLRELRKGTDVPVIVVSARTERVDRIVALEMGADDYLDKPVDMRELLVRTRNLYRRSSLARSNNSIDKVPAHIDFEGWTLDTEKWRLVTPDGADMHLTRAEFNLLQFLVMRSGSVVMRERLHALVSNREWSPLDRSVDVLIARLRSKIESDPKKPRMIITVHGVGYRFMGERGPVAHPH